MKDDENRSIRLTEDVFRPNEWELSSDFCPWTVSAWLSTEPDVPVEFSNTFELRQKYDLLSEDRDSIEMVLHENLYTYDCDSFIAGNLHNNKLKWRSITEDEQILDWIDNKVDIRSF